MAKSKAAAFRRVLRESDLADLLADSKARDCKEYIHTQMSHHAKALEIYTAAYQHVQSMNEDEMVEVRGHATNKELFIDCHKYPLTMSDNHVHNSNTCSRSVHR